jgi:hypothetical protein
LEEQNERLKRKKEDHEKEYILNGDEDAYETFDDMYQDEMNIDHLEHHLNVKDDNLMDEDIDKAFDNDKERIHDEEFEAELARIDEEVSLNEGEEMELDLTKKEKLFDKRKTESEVPVKKREKLEMQQIVRNDHVS